MSEAGFLQQSMGHYQSAQQWDMAGAVLNAAGLPSGRFFQSLAHRQQLSGRMAELSARMSRLVPDDEVLAVSPPSSDAVELTPPDGIHKGVYAKAVGAYPGGQTRFLQGYTSLKGVLESKTDARLETMLSAYPESVGKMVYAYQSNPDAVTDAADPLRQAALLGGAHNILADFYGEDVSDNTDDDIVP
jgi:hypothetical protein